MYIKNQLGSGLSSSRQRPSGKAIVIELLLFGKAIEETLFKVEWIERRFLWRYRGLSRVHVIGG